MSDPQTTNMLDASMLQLARAIAALGVMQGHLRQMEANADDEARAEIYKKAATAQAAAGANLCAEVHTHLVGFIEAMTPAPRIARVK